MFTCQVFTHHVTTNQPIRRRVYLSTIADPASEHVKIYECKFLLLGKHSSKTASGRRPVPTLDSFSMFVCPNQSLHVSSKSVCDCGPCNANISRAMFSWLAFVPPYQQGCQLWLEAFHPGISLDINMDILNKGYAAIKIFHVLAKFVIEKHLYNLYRFSLIFVRTGLLSQVRCHKPGVHAQSS